MIRDPELIKMVLLEFEKLDFPDSTARISVPGFDANVINYHIHLLHDVGWITGDYREAGRTGVWINKRLTSNGHDILEKMKNDTVWKKTKDQIIEKGGGMALDIISALLTAYMKAQMGLP